MTGFFRQRKNHGGSTKEWSRHGFFFVCTGLFFDRQWPLGITDSPVAVAVAERSAALRDWPATVAAPARSALAFQAREGRAAPPPGHSTLRVSGLIGPT